jgi:hypothetical protein
MTHSFKPAGAALAAVVAGLAVPVTVSAEAPDLGGTETPAQQAQSFANALAAMGDGRATPFGETPEPNSALLDVPLGGLGSPTDFG